MHIKYGFWMTFMWTEVENHWYNQTKKSISQLRILTIIII